MITAPLQPTLGLRVDARIALGTVEMARAAYGCDAETISEMVDCGRLRWVFDIGLHGADSRISGAGPQPRTLRFWLAELRDPALTAELLAWEAIDQIIGTSRERLRSVELERHVLMCSASLVYQLIRAAELQGPLIGHSQFVYRTSLHSFLTRRLQQ